MLTSRLRDIRTSQGYTQQDIASLLGVSKQEYNRWENGKHQPSNEIVMRLAQILGVSTDYLLGRNDSADQNISESDLTPDEIELLRAYRTGRIWDILRLIHQIAPEVTKGVYPPESPTSDAE